MLDTSIGSITGLKVLDLGCDNRPYMPLFLERGYSYEGADLPGNSLADITVNADGTVFCADATYNVILSTQVLEHVEDPLLHLRECSRLLKPGGQLILTTHGTYFYHPCPIDYWRWTGEGLRHVVEQSEFSSVTIEGLVGAAPTAIFHFRKATQWFFPRFLGIRFLYGFLLQQCMMIAECLHTDASRQKDSMIFLVVAKKA